VAKQLGLLHELVPKAARIAVLLNPRTAISAETTLQAVQEAARALQLEIQVLKTGSVDEIDAAFAAQRRSRRSPLSSRQPRPNPRSRSVRGRAGKARGAGAAFLDTAACEHAAATGAGSTAVGLNANATGTVATAYGNSAIANGDNATATGAFSPANGISATATGADSFANGSAATATGA
jgi:hypothetical protein